MFLAYFHNFFLWNREYKENIKIVDAGIKKIEEIIEEFYHYDKKTAYVFTADHGMTDWGKCPVCIYIIYHRKNLRKKVTVDFRLSRAD